MPHESKLSGSYLPQNTTFAPRNCVNAAGDCLATVGATAMSNQPMSTSHTVAPLLVTADPPLSLGTASASGLVTGGGAIVTCQARAPLRIFDQNWVRMKTSPYWPLPPGKAFAVNRPDNRTALVTDVLSSWTLLPVNRNRIGVITFGIFAVLVTPGPKPTIV